MTETRCFHCRLDVAPVDEDGCCNSCGADLGCTCELEPARGTHADDCAISIREDRDRLRVQGEILSREKSAYTVERTHAALVQLLTAARKQAQAMQYTYSTSNAMVGKGGDKMEERTIGAGVVNNLLTENDFIEAERDQVTTLERIVRNLKPIPQYATGNGLVLPDAGFTLSTDEMDYLGF